MSNSAVSAELSWKLPNRPAGLPGLSGNNFWVEPEDVDMFPNEYEIWKLLEHREADLRRKAELSRFLEEIQADQPGFLERLLTRSGEILIFVGEKLITRYEPKFETRTSSTQPCS